MTERAEYAERTTREKGPSDVIGAAIKVARISLTRYSRQSHSVWLIRDLRQVRLDGSARKAGEQRGARLEASGHRIARSPRPIFDSIRRGLDETARVRNFCLWCRGPFRVRLLDPCYHRADPRQMLEVGTDDQPHFTREQALRHSIGRVQERHLRYGKAAASGPSRHGPRSGLIPSH
jgi:hypothetical protein